MTGRRSEGVLFSVDNLFKKIVSGVGVFIAGFMLKVVEFPAGAKRGEVPPEILQQLALVFLPTVGVLYGLAIVCLCFFNIDQAKHEDNLRRLRDAALLADQVGAEEEAGAAAGVAGGGPLVNPR